MKFNKVTAAQSLKQNMVKPSINVNEIAKERCDKLLALAKETYEKNQELALRYVKLARAIAMRHRLKLGRKLFCKKCNTIFIPGFTIVTRIDMKRKEKTVTCKNCKNKLTSHIGAKK